EKALRLPLKPEDLVAALAGRVAPPADLTSAELQPPDEVGPSIDLVSPAGRRRWWIDLETGTVRQLEIFGSPFNALVKYRRSGAGALTGFDVEAAQSYLTGSGTHHKLVRGGGGGSARHDGDPEGSENTGHPLNDRQAHAIVRCLVEAVGDGPSPRAQRCGQDQPDVGGARPAQRRLPRDRHGHADRGPVRSAGGRGRG